MIGRYPAGHLHINLDLFAKGFFGLERLLTAKPVQELDSQGAAVKIPVEIQQVSLDEKLLAVECRAVSNADGGRN